MTSPDAADPIARLAAAHGVAPPAPATAAATDLTAAATLVAVDEIDVGAGRDTTMLPAALAAAAGLPGRGVMFAGDLAVLRAGLVQLARTQRPGCPRLVVVGDVPYGDAATVFAAGDFAAAAAALATGAPACALLVVEPWLPEPAAAAALRALLAQARAVGIPTVCDEERTAGRAAATTVHAEQALAADFVVLGPALAAGLPFAARVGGAPGTAGPAPEPVAAHVAAALLHAGGGRTLAAGLGALGQALRDATNAAAAREQLRIAWRGPVTMSQLVFADQEGAPGALIEHHFGLELAALGWRVQGPLLFGAALRRGAPAALLAAFDRALARIRVKLIEYNSYLSGGLAFAWPGGDATLRARGVGVYRYPRLAAVRVAPVPDGPGMRIDFAPGQLGEVTSSGFFVPTMYDGDVEVVARYVLRRWHAGPDSACLGLFLQNAPSSARYYAQVMSTADRPHERRVAAGLAGHVHTRHAAPADSGWLRLQRTAGTLTAWWRADAAAPWTELGRCAATADPIFVGAKIWSKVSTDGLVADIVDLQVHGRPAAAQEALLGPVPDPRG